MIECALDELEHSLFWEGFEEEARAYLATYPQERDERSRNRFIGDANKREHVAMPALRLTG